MRLPRWAVPAVGTIVVAGAIGARWWNGVEEKERARAEARASEQSAVRITATLGAEPCAGTRPIRITVKNTAARTLEAVSFHLGVYEEGRAGDLDPSAPDQEWAVLLAPGAEASRCVAATFPVEPRHILKAERRGLDRATFVGSEERKKP